MLALACGFGCKLQANRPLSTHPICIALEEARGQMMEKEKHPHRLSKPTSWMTAAAMPKDRRRGTSALFLVHLTPTLFSGPHLFCLWWGGRACRNGTLRFRHRAAGSANAAAGEHCPLSHTKGATPPPPSNVFLCATHTPPIHPLTPAPHPRRDALCTADGRQRGGLFGFWVSGVRTKSQFLAAGPSLSPSIREHPSQPCSPPRA